MANRGRMIKYNGETKNITAWAKHLGLSNSVLTKRLNAGWSIERALTASLCTRGRKSKATSGFTMPALRDYERHLLGVKRDLIKTLREFIRSQQHQANRRAREFAKDFTVRMEAAGQLPPSVVEDLLIKHRAGAKTFCDPFQTTHSPSREIDFK